MKEKYLVLLFGESGAGKSVLCANAVAAGEVGAFNDIPENMYGSVRSYTTRACRNDFDKSTHTFVADEEFDQVMKDETVLAYSEFDGHRYAATKEQIDQDSADVLIYTVDIRGICDVLKAYHGDRHIIPVYLSVDEAERLHRMDNRGDSAEQRIVHDREVFPSNMIAAIPHITIDGSASENDVFWQFHRAIVDYTSIFE